MLKPIGVDLKSLLTEFWRRWTALCGYDEQQDRAHAGNCP